jgi:hypothetical protein
MVRSFIEGITPVPVPVHAPSDSKTILIESTPDRESFVVSKSLLYGISLVLGIIIAGGTIFGVLGRSFFVARDEFGKFKETEHEIAAKNALQDLREKSELAQKLERIGASLDRLEADVQMIKKDMPKVRRKN